MSTHALPVGTVNFPVNLPADLRRDAGRLAAMHGKALGALIREMIESRVEAARRSGLIDTAGQLVARLGCVALAAIGIGAIMAQVFSGDEMVARRVVRRVRRNDEVALTMEGEA